MKRASHPMTKSDPLYRYRRRVDLVPRQVGMDLCLYDATTNQLHVLNPMAAAIWQHITPDRSVEAITNGFALSFEADDDFIHKIQADVLATVNDFKTKQLIIRDDEKSPQPPPKHKTPATVTIPDPAISTNAGSGYSSAHIKTFTASDLEKIFHLQPPLQGVMRQFSDTYSPTQPGGG